MKRYPLFLNLAGKKIAVFGGGAVALRKIRALLECGALVEAVSPEFSKPVRALARRHCGLKLRRRASFSSALRSARLAFIVTSDRKFNEKAAQECRKRKILVNVADQPDICDFFVPAFFRKGKLEIAISTGGASPLLARRFRQELAKKIRPEAFRLLERMERFRSTAFSSFETPKERKKFLQKKMGKNFHFLSQGNGKGRSSS